VTLVKKPSEPEKIHQVHGPVRLWRDDLEEIVQLLREGAPDGHIETDEYVLDHVAELAQLKAAQIGSFSFIDEAAGVELALTDYACTLTIADPSLTQRGAATEVARILARNQLPTNTLLRALPYLAAAIGFALAMIVPWGRNGLILSILGAIIVGGVSLSVVTAEKWVARRRHFLPQSILSTRTRAEAPTFWERRSEEIVIQAVVSLVSLAVGGVLGYLIDTLTR